MSEPSVSRRCANVGESLRPGASFEIYYELLIKFGAYLFIATPDSQLKFNLFNNNLVKSQKLSLRLFDYFNTNLREQIFKVLLSVTQKGDLVRWYTAHAASGRIKQAIDAAAELIIAARLCQDLRGLTVPAGRGLGFVPLIGLLSSCNYFVLDHHLSIAAHAEHVA